MNAIDELLGKYCDPVALHKRQWKSDEVCKAVCALSLVVRHYFFGYCDIAIVAASLLEQSEPLEALDAFALPVKKMQALAHVAYRHYDEALCILDPLRAVHADDRFITGLHSICMERQPARRRQGQRRGGGPK